jgi:hypothetical protein
MPEQLAAYLDDHLAGARFALDVLERLHDSFTGKPLGDLASRLLEEIDEDRAVLQKLAEDIGSGGSATKNLTSWIAEKASRFKLRFSSETDLGTFEALETLALGVLGKLKLWQALSAIKTADARLQSLDFERLMSRAKSQHDRLEAHRLKLATAFVQSTEE